MPPASTMTGTRCRPGQLGGRQLRQRAVRRGQHDRLGLRQLCPDPRRGGCGSRTRRRECGPARSAGSCRDRSTAASPGGQPVAQAAGSMLATAARVEPEHARHVRAALPVAVRPDRRPAPPRRSSPSASATRRSSSRARRCRRPARRARSRWRYARRSPARAARPAPSARRQVPGLVFLRRAHVEHIEGAPVRFGPPGGERRLVDPRDAAALGHPRRRLDRRLPPGSETSGGRRVAPCTTSNPARCQAIVPSFSDTTLLRTPALVSDCAPMMLRVRPPQLTITVVSGDGTRSAKR